MALFGPTGRSGCRRAPGPPESWRTHRAGVQLADSRLARRRTSPAGGAGRHRTGCAVRRGGCRRGFRMPRSGSARRRACSSSLARSAAALAPTVDALPLMVCRVAALPSTSPSPSWRSSWGEEVLHIRNEAPQHSTISSSCRRNARRYRPALDQFARVSSLPAPPCRRSCRDDRADKAPGAPCRSASPHGRSCPPPGRLRGRPARRWRSWARIGSSAKRPSARIRRVASRPSISGICMSISTASNGTLASSTC